MSDEYGWRQLGSAVNAVLLQVKTKAIRRGSLSNTTLTLPAEEKATAPPSTPVTLSEPSRFRLSNISAKRFLSEPEPSSVELQAELPSEMKESSKRKAARSSRVARSFQGQQG